ncbi:ALOX5 [Mytilus edulis]|uniref:ALOX5 n=1 Tax=Mytilus edulis TaxID=6550 RepID=A0A8S3Q6W4_MYTED|nr:ALOX5 [Mytilus edulis]
MKRWRLDIHGTLPADLRRRGVFDDINNDVRVLPGVYHMRDDALLLYDAIKTYVEKYVELYFPNDDLITTDTEIQDWGRELVRQREDGGLGILRPVRMGTILEMIAQRDTLPKLMYITKVLSQKTTKSLGDFEKQLIVDPLAVKIVEEFRQTLLDIGHQIDERNHTRTHPYEWLHPMAIPNAISI